jgi:hypothetical protein
MTSPILDLTIQDLKQSGPINPAGSPWIYLPTDLNKSVKGDYLYLGYTKQIIQNVSQPVTELNFFSDSNPQQGPQSGWSKWNSTDLNKGAGGRYIYMEWNVGQPNKAPITNVMVLPTSQSSPPAVPGWTHVGVDLNKGAGGLYIWAYYSTVL